jgi:hypothetical protein
MMKISTAKLHNHDTLLQSNVDCLCDFEISSLGHSGYLGEDAASNVL